MKAAFTLIPSESRRLIARKDQSDLPEWLRG